MKLLLPLFAGLAVSVPAQDTDGDAREPDRLYALPTLTHSPLVPRLVATSRGYGLRIDVGDGPMRVERISIEAVAHDSEEQVVILDGEAVRVGAPRLPRDLRSVLDRSLLPQIARLDRIAGLPLQWGIITRDPGSVLEVGAPLGEDELVWMAAVSDELFPFLLDQARLRGEVARVSSPWPGCALRPNNPRFILDAAEAVDQAFIATIRRVVTRKRVPVTVREARAGERTVSLAGPIDLGAGEDLEIWVTPPGDGESETWTLLVSSSVQADVTPIRLREAPESDGPLIPRVLDVHLEGPAEQLDIRPTMGPGAAWGDADGDGWNDLYLVQGGGRDGSVVASNRMLRNVAGKLDDATSTSGTGDTGHGMGAQFFDAEGDGDLDLYVANYGADVLYRNDGKGVFADVSASAGVGGDLWSAGIAAADHDLDGDLDLYVTSYLVYDESLMPPADDLARYQREDPTTMLPFAFPGQRNTFLRNDTTSATDEPKFTDVTKELKLLDEAGRGMQPVFWDFDRNGTQDLYVANDVSYNVLWRNEGDGSFRDVSFGTGMDDPRGGMGVAIGDVDADGDEDLFLTNWELESNALYRNNLLSHRSQRHRVATFRDVTVTSGFAAHCIGVTSWGAELFDVDNDGDLDLFVANGYTSPDYESTTICVGQPNHLFLNDGEGSFERVPAESAQLGLTELPSRCVLACDYDQDGQVELVVTANNAPILLLESHLARESHWLVVRPRGKSRNTHAIGAEVTLTADGRRQRRSLRAGTGYLGGNAPELHFGLGKATKVDELVVRWPDGSESRHTIEGVDRVVVVEQPR